MQKMPVRSLKTIKKSTNKPSYFSVVGLFLSIVILLATTAFAGNAIKGAIKPGQALTPLGNPDPSSNQPDVKGSSICADFENSKKELISSIQPDRKWVLKGAEIADEQKQLGFTVTLGPKFEEVSKSLESWEVNYSILRTSYKNSIVKPEVYSPTMRGSIDTNLLNPGSYNAQAVLETSCGTLLSKTFQFNVSYPLYVTWTLDWEGYNKSIPYMSSIAKVANTHGIPMTHFFNPRIYATDKVTAEEAAKITNFVKSRRDKNGDDIGLHLHMFPEMVAAAGVEPQTTPAWGWNTGDGYDILVMGYSYEKMDKVLDWSRAKFIENGLGAPTMFRAGGWYADEGTLKAIEDNGFILDSSGRTKFTLGYNGIAIPWDLPATAQPYRPNYKDQNSSAGFDSDLMKLWEFPNNGGDSTALKKNEMYGRFQQNYNGKPLESRKAVNFLTHPDYYYIDKAQIEPLFNDVDQHLYASDKGPVIYSNLSNVYKIFTTQ